MVKKNCLTFLAKIDSSICPNTYGFFSGFFSNFRISFYFLKKRSKVTKFGDVFLKRLDNTLKKFLCNRSQRYANTTQTFLDKRNFRK